MIETAKHWIGGRWVESANGLVAESLNPATGKVLGSFADAGKADAEAAIRAARQAFDTGQWAHQPRLREKVLLDFANRMEANLAGLAQLLTADNGKLLAEATGEINASISELRYYAGLSRNIFGRITELEPGLFSSLVREPLGVAGIIVPWNAPIVLMIRSLAPALAAGCSAVVKAAPQTAIANERVFRLLAEVSDLPPGIVNMFSETGSDGAKEMVDSVDVDVISFTGSTEVGKQIMASGAKTLKRLGLELGGNAPCIVFDDADLDQAVPALVRAGMFMSGQYCCSATRVLVHHSILEQTQEKLSDVMRSLVIGPGKEPKSQMGPMINAAGCQRVNDLLKSASQTDEILCQVNPPGGDLATGFFLGPSLIHASNPKSLLYTEEVFGPVLVIDAFDDEEEAIAKANNTRYGLAASIWSRDLQRSQRVAHKVQSGTVWINSHGRTFPEIENGGYKESGIGRLHGVEGLSEFLETKHISWTTNP